MPLLSRLCPLLAFSSAVANALDTSFIVPRAGASSGCISDRYTACGGNLPADFCCAADSTCVVTYGTSSSENTTAICCPTGTDCTVIAPITCSIQMLNVTAYPDSQVLSTELDTALTTCAGKCCPPGYQCYQNTCVQSSKHVVTASRAVPSVFITASTASQSASATLLPPQRTSTKKHTTTTSKAAAKTTLSSSTRAPTATAAASSSVAAAAAAATTPTPTPEPSPGTPELSKRAVIGLGVASGACAVLLAMLALCYRRHLLGGWRRFKSSFSSSFSSSRSTRSSGSSVKYTTTDDAPPLPRPAPTWAIPLSADWWWEPVQRQWPWVKPPWQSPRPSSTGWPKTHNSSAPFSTPLSSVNPPLSRFDTHYDPETGIVISPPSRSAARFSAAPGPKSPKPPRSPNKATKTKRNICSRLSSGFYRIKSLPPIPQSSPTSPTLALSSNFASAPSALKVPAVHRVHGLHSLHAQPFSLLGESPLMMLQEVEGAPVPAAPKTPPSAHTHATPSECELLLPIPIQPESPTTSSPWPRPLRLPRQPPGHGYTPVSQATAHGRSVSDTVPSRPRLVAEEYGTYPQQHPHQSISQLPSQRSPPPAAPPASARPPSTRDCLCQPPQRSASPIELPATPVTARMLEASMSPLGHRPSAESSTPISAFGITSGSGRDERHQRQRPREYHRHTSYIPRGHNFAPAYGDPEPACPYPRARDSLRPPPTLPVLELPQARSLPPLVTGAPLVPPQGQHAQSPKSAYVETPMSYHSMQSLQSPTTPRIEEAHVQRLPRMTQARMMQPYQQPSIVVVVRPSSGEAVPGSARNSP